jgi:hypothetical protein
MKTGMPIAPLGGVGEFMGKISKSVLALTLGILTLHSAATSAATIIPLRECQYEEGSSSLKAQKLVHKIPAGKLIDLSFQSKEAYQYPIVDVQLKAGAKAARQVDQIHLKKIEGGLNFVTFQAPKSTTQDHFLVVKINEKDCFYAQIRSLELRPDEREASQQPQFIRAEVLPIASNCSLQASENNADYSAMLVSIICFSALLLLLYRLRIRSHRIQL